MARRRVAKKYASIRAMVRDLEDLVDGEKWTLDTEACAAWKKRPWAGAGTVICEKPRKTPNPDHTYDVSPYIVELSWLFDYLKILCSEFVRAPTACGRHAIRKPRFWAAAGSGGGSNRRTSRSSVGQRLWKCRRAS